MIVYLDAGALRRIYVGDDGSDEARRKVEEASIVASSVVSYPEISAYFAALHQRGAVGAKEHRTLRSELDRDWPHLLKLEVTEPVWRRAAQIAASYLLTGGQSLHVASYLVLAEVDRARTTVFWSPDERVRLAARAAESV